MEKDYLKIKIGIIGGGQLGKMMIQEAKKMGFFITILDPTYNCPAHSISDEHIVAEFNDREAIMLLASKSDVVTYEFEHIGYETLMELENSGKKIYPTPKSLKIIQNKFTQKQVLENNNIQIADFVKVENINDIIKAGEKFGYPFILKTCTGGYDGKGNAYIKDKNSIKDAFSILNGKNNELMAEKFVQFVMETSILACRGINGSIAVYPVGNNIHKHNILIETSVPANISERTKNIAMKIANEVMEIFEGIGMFCIEMFITKQGDILVNEIAPRPHNSGHYSIEGCVTSQFEQHMRAITGLPLGDTSLIRPTVMMNLLGEDNFYGNPYISGLYDALQIKGVKVHMYGKENTSPKRKMGHLTVTADTLKEALKNAHDAFNKIKIISKEEKK